MSNKTIWNSYEIDCSNCKKFIGVIGSIELYDEIEKEGIYCSDNCCAMSKEGK